MNAARNLLALTALVVFAAANGNADEDSKELVAFRDAAIGAYAFGDHALAFEIASHGATTLASESERRVMEAFLANLRKRSEDGYIALGPAGIKRLEAVRAQLKKNHRIDEVGADDLRWALLGDGRPYILDEARASTGATDGLWWRALRRFENATGKLTPDGTLSLWFGEPDIWRLNHMADIAQKLAERRQVTELEAQFAADNRWLKSLYVNYVKAGGAEKIAADAGANADRHAREETAQSELERHSLRVKHRELLAEKNGLEAEIGKLKLRIRRVSGIKSDAGVAAKSKLDAEMEAANKKTKAIEAQIRENLRQQGDLERAPGVK
ncbi:MAG TPA: hypothetical protein VGG64_17385 [Pirellulales bacterium]|jgi:hypothetical protein